MLRHSVCLFPAIALFDQAPVCVHEIDTDGRLLSTSQAGLELLRAADVDEVRGKPLLDLVGVEDRQRVGRLLKQAFAGAAAELNVAVTSDTRPRAFAFCVVPVPDAHGSVARLICIAFDLSKREAEQQELLRLNRVQAVLLQCNHSLARAADETALMQAVCDNVVGPGGYGFAWAGFVRRAECTGVRLIAHARSAQSDFAATLVAAANAAEYPSACRVAIDSARPLILRDFEQRPDLAPWANVATQAGYSAMVALPLRTRFGTFGNLSIFSADADAFDDGEVALLAELAQDLAHGIQTVRLRAAEAQRIRRLREEVEREERKRIAATLHDVVGQSLQSVNLSLKRLRAAATTDTQSPDCLLQAALGEVQITIEQLRELGKELRPPCLESMRFTEAVRCQCDATGAHAGVAIRLHASGVYAIQTQRLKEQCFLSFREALGNAVRHA